MDPCSKKNVGRIAAGSHVLTSSYTPAQKKEMLGGMVVYARNAAPPAQKNKMLGGMMVVARNDAPPAQKNKMLGGMVVKSILLLLNAEYLVSFQQNSGADWGSSS